MLSRTKVGLVGCGEIVRLVHLNILTQLPEAELTALAEVDPERRHAAQLRAPAAQSYATYQDLLAQADVDAVVICLPSALHAEAAEAALAMNKHVYLEKPLATSLGDAQRLVAAWQQSQVVGMIGFNYRFSALHLALQQHIRAGTAGALVGARSLFSTPPQLLPRWKQQRATGGGVLLDLASHHIDMVRFLFAQEICAVFASLRSQTTEDDSAFLELQLADGMLVQSFFSLNTVQEDRFAVYGRQGKLAVDRHRSPAVDINGRGDSSALKRWCPDWAVLQRRLRRLWGSSYEPSYSAALQHFVRQIRSAEPAAPDFYDGYRSLAVVTAAEESARSGRRVAVAEVDKGFASRDAQAVILR
ncbi:MAG: Gfo/Idh/MocA family oxidoreductase [Deltaproteobacteria bacterium]|nr:Gfo/Idh/MocA family oxidoreductase [Deltaproteobacteria bacterium]